MKQDKVSYYELTKELRNRGLLRRIEVKKRLGGVSDFTIAKLVKSGILEQVQIGRFRYIKTVTLDNYINSLVSRNQ